MNENLSVFVGPRSPETWIRLSRAMSWQKERVAMEEKRKNKKGLLAVLLVLLLVLSIAFVGTLARYVKAGSGSDQAVAAEFGLNIPATFDLFADSYTNVEADEDGKKIIAPGTSGSYDFVVTGTSEVAYTVSADITLEYSEEWDDYAPLQFSIDGENWMTFEEFKTKLSDELSEELMAPNSTYSSENSINWRWPFQVSTENDLKDTAIGQAAATGTAPQVIVTVEVTAAQA